MTTPAPASAERPSPARIWTWAALGLAVLGFVVRCLSWRSIFGAQDVAIMDVDGWYHVRRAHLLAQAWPLNPDVDPMLAAPHGLPIPWPPLFDLVLALPLMAGASDQTHLALAALFIPLLGAASVVLTWSLARRVMPAPAALVAAALQALMEGPIYTSQLGRVDHHAVVAPVCLAMFVAVLNAVEPQRRNAVPWAWLAAVLAAVGSLSWIVTPPLYFLPIPVLLFILGVQGKPVRPAVSIVLLGGSALLVGLGLLWSANLRDRPFSLYLPSLLLLVPYVLAIPVHWAGQGWKAVAWRVAAVAAAAGVLGVLVPGAWEAVSLALSTVGGQDPSYLMASEARSPLKDPSLTTLLQTISAYTRLLPLAPIMLVVMVDRAIRSGRAQDILTGVFSLLGFLLLMLQVRFGEYASPALALLFAWSGAAAWEALKPALAAMPAKRSRPLMAGTVMALVGALWTIPVGLQFMAGQDLAGFHRSQLAFGALMKRVVPEAPVVDGHAAWAVAASWQDSIPLLTGSNRPMAVSSFATAEATAANVPAFSAFLESNEDKALALLDGHHIRYLAISPILAEIPAMAAMTQWPEQLVDFQWQRDGGRSVDIYTPLEPLSRALHTRLLLADGSAMTLGGVNHIPVHHLRLVVESLDNVVTLGVQTAHFKLFQRVAGVTVAGVLEGGGVVEVMVPVETNTGRRFEFHTGVLAAPDGQFSVTIPYSQDAPTGTARATGPAVLRAHAQEFVCPLLEADVVAGKSFPWASCKPVAAP